jgi:hypothetical protein
LANFPYKEAIEAWESENKWYGDSWVIILVVVVSFETWPNFHIFMNHFSFHDVKPIFLIMLQLIILSIGFGNYGDTYWTHGWFWVLVSQCKLFHLGYEPSFNHFFLLNFNIFNV